MRTAVSVSDESIVAERDLDVVVIGAGFAGLYQVYQLREMGFRVQGFEAGDSVGGTWYWNRYPGARCDSESMYYSFSFLPDLEQEWPLNERYPGQPVILKYLETVAQKLDLYKDFVFRARVASITYNDDTQRWTVAVQNGSPVTAKWVVTAVGCLSDANLPDIKGVETFQGDVYHTGRWPREPVDFSNKRVGIIGTGATAIQAIPVIAEMAGHLTVFQRTAQFTIPAANGPLDPAFEKSWKGAYKEWRRRARVSQGGFPYTGIDRSALEVSDEERRAAFEAGWELGGFMFVLGTFNDLLIDEEANKTAADFVKSKIDEIVKDPEVAELLKPSGYPLGSKRLPLDTNYYETYNRPNVTLVDLRRAPIEEITAKGIRTAAGEHELDILIFATGFDALTGPLLAMNITGRHGQKLADKWAEGPKTYLGLAVPEFPNLFTITGPGSPSVLSNMPVSIEQHVEWISRCIGYMRDHGVDSIEATDEATEQWTAHVQEVAAMTLYPKAASWYMGANIPGKPRLFLPYVGGVGNYRQKCFEVEEHSYEGFRLQSEKEATSV
jgi:cation diffusion facilitator CzcD-associated flavoprotein CzcO